MMGSFAYIRGNLEGAWAVMLGRADGLRLLDTSLEGFWRSFAAVIFLLPLAFLAMMSQAKLVGVSAEAPEAAAAEFGFVAGSFAVLFDWFTFPLIFAVVARMFGLGGRYVPFIVSRNWASLIIGAMVAVVHILHLVGVIPSAVAPYLMLAVIAVALRFSYVIARTALAVSMGMALPIVALDLVISLTIWSAFERLS